MAVVGGVVYAYMSSVYLESLALVSVLFFILSCPLLG